VIVAEKLKSYRFQAFFQTAKLIAKNKRPPGNAKNIVIPQNIPFMTQ